MCVMYVVIRRWTDAAGLADPLQRREQEVRDLMSGVPGFVAYYATREGGSVTTVTVCDDRAGTEESTRRAGAWIRQHLASEGIGAPAVTEGEAFLRF